MALKPGAYLWTQEDWEQLQRLVRYAREAPPDAIVRFDCISDHEAAETRKRLPEDLLGKVHFSALFTDRVSDFLEVR